MPQKNQSQKLKKLPALRALLAGWDQALDHPALACVPGCSVCCSDRVMLTTLEGHLLRKALLQSGGEELLARAAAQPTTPGSQPALTFNAEAALWLQGRQPPQELAPPLESACPLLKDGLCAAYEARPLACRVMISRETCAQGGSALQEPFWLTLAGAFHQMVEHLDQGGGFGLLPNVLSHLEGEDAAPLLVCQPLPGLPAPERHQARLQTAINKVLAQPVLGRPLGAWLEE